MSAQRRNDDTEVLCVFTRSNNRDVVEDCMSYLYKPQARHPKIRTPPQACDPHDTILRASTVAEDQFRSRRLIEASLPAMAESMYDVLRKSSTYSFALLSDIAH